MPLLLEKAVGRKLVGVEADEVSLVDRPANKREGFLLMKNEAAPPTVDEIRERLTKATAKVTVTIDTEKVVPELKKMLDPDLEVDETVRESVDTLLKFFGEDTQHALTDDSKLLDEIAQIIHDNVPKPDPNDLIAKQLEEAWERFTTNMHGGLDPDLARGQLMADVRKIAPDVEFNDDESKEDE